MKIKAEIKLTQMQQEHLELCAKGIVCRGAWGEWWVQLYPHHGGKEVELNTRVMDNLVKKGFFTPGIAMVRNVHFSDLGREAVNRIRRKD